MRGLRDYIYNVDTKILDMIKKAITFDDGMYFVNFSESFPYYDKLNDLINEDKLQPTIRALTSHVDTLKLVDGGGCMPVKILDMFWKPDMYYVDDGKD